MSDKKITVDIDCLQRGITGELTFDSGQFDELEVSEISEMIVRVIESWCESRKFIFDNLEEYNVTFN